MKLEVTLCLLALLRPFEDEPFICLSHEPTAGLSRVIQAVLNVLAHYLATGLDVFLSCWREDCRKRRLEVCHHPVFKL